MNDLVFRHFGPVGATIIFITLYAISLLYLTNFRLGEWLRGKWSREPELDPNLPPEEKALERRRRDLEKQARQLQEEMEKSVKPAKPAERSRLAADLQPVPPPTARTLHPPTPP